MNCIAHRGFACTNPENTLLAVRDAVERADAVEVDARRCRSGELVVCHDPTVDRVTGRTGRVDAFDSEALASMSVEGSGAGIPTLAAVARAVPPERSLHVELKERGLGADVVALAAETDCPIVVSSFDRRALGEVVGVRKTARAAPTALLVTDLSDPDGVLRAARDLDCRAVHPPIDATSSEFVDRSHDEDLAVNAWTLTDPSETRRARSAGVDGIIADDPACCPATRT